MFCGNCGKQLSVDSAFCGQCGAKTQAIANTENYANETEFALPYDFMPDEFEKPKSKIPIISAIVAVIVIVFAAIWFFDLFDINERLFGSDDSNYSNEQLMQSEEYQADSAENDIASYPGLNTPTPITESTPVPAETPAPTPVPTPTPAPTPPPEEAPESPNVEQNIMDIPFEHMSDIERAMYYYQTRFVQAVDAYDFNLLSDYIDPNGRLFNEQRRLIDHYRNSGIRLRFIHYRIDSTIRLNDGEYQLVVYEYFYTHSEAQGTLYREFRNTYIVRRTPIGYRVSELTELITVVSRNADIEW